MDESVSRIVACLRGAGEPTRIRVLALLRQCDLAVGELVQILGQSQPRLSHHLKTLSSAGLVERLPEGSWVFYRAASQGRMRVFLDNLFDQIDLDADDFARDRAQLELVRETRAANAGHYFSSVADTWDTVRSLHYPEADIERALLSLAGPGPYRRIIDFGTGTGRMLQLFAEKTRRAEGLDMSHQMLTVARANLEEAGITNAQVRQGNVTATPFEDEVADLVIIHQVLHFIDAPEHVLAEAARVLVPGGRLLIADFAPHDLEFLRTEHGHHRLGVRDDNLRNWVNRTGLELSPPQCFDPPDQSAPGLTVHLWAADKPAQPAQRKEAAI